MMDGKQKTVHPLQRYVYVCIYRQLYGDSRCKFRVQSYANEECNERICKEAKWVAVWKATSKIGRDNLR